MTILLPVSAIVLGGVIGYLFGSIQNAALRRHEKRQDRGQFKNGWTLIPGSMTRIAMFMMLLATVQILCPMFFEGNTTQWLISAGIILGYGWKLFEKLRQQMLTIV